MLNCVLASNAGLITAKPEKKKNVFATLITDATVKKNLRAHAKHSQAQASKQSNNKCM